MAPRIPLLRRFSGLPESLEPRTRPARQRDPVPTRPAQARSAHSGPGRRPPPGSAKAGERGWTGGARGSEGRRTVRQESAWGAPQTPPCLRVGRRQSSTQTDPHLPGLQLTSPIFLFHLARGRDFPFHSPVTTGRRHQTQHRRHTGPPARRDRERELDVAFTSTPVPRSGFWPRCPAPRP